MQTHGKDYDVHPYQFQNQLGNDISDLVFKVPSWDKYRPNIERPSPGWDNYWGVRRASARDNYYHNLTLPGTNKQQGYLEYMAKYARARLAWDPAEVAKQASQEKRMLIMFNNVYDVSAYFSSSVKFFPESMNNLFTTYVGQDATANFNTLVRSDPQEGTGKRDIVFCMNNLFYIGTVDGRNGFQCRLSNILLLAASIVIVAVIAFKFLAALEFYTTKEPEDHDKFVICQVPCLFIY